MILFNFDVDEGDLINRLQTLYCVKLELHGKIQVQVARESLGSRLALLKIPVLYDGAFKHLSVLVKESTSYELMMLSIANKLIPDHSPCILKYSLTDDTAWIWMENITTWIDGGGSLRYRVLENLVDGLFEMHNSLFSKITLVEEAFSNIGKVGKDYIVSKCRYNFEGLCKLVKGKGPFVELSQSDLDVIGHRLEVTLTGIEGKDFPRTLIHGNYVPTSVRARDLSNGDIQVVAYDWNLASIGWPQLDLALLMDRVAVIMEYQDLPSPEKLLVERYMWRMTDWGYDCTDFLSFYKVCYFFRILPLLAQWLCIYKTCDDSRRLKVEVVGKVKRLKSNYIDI